MALPLIAATALASAIGASAAHHDAPDMEKACKELKDSVMDSDKVMLYCGQGICNDSEAQKCKDGMFSFKLETELKNGGGDYSCLQRCVDHDGHMMHDDDDHMHDDKDSMDKDSMKDKDMSDGDSATASDKDTVSIGGMDDDADDMNDEESDAMAPMMGPTMAGACDNILDALAANEDGEVLVKIAAKALMPATINLLSDPMANLTVLVPPMEDLLKLLGGRQSELVSEDDLRTILKLHVLPDALPAAELIALDGEMVATAAGESDMLMVSFTEETVAFMANNTAIVTEADIDTCADSQVIHMLDALLMPEGMDLDLEKLPVGNLLELGTKPEAPPAENNQGPAEREGPAETDTMGGAAGVAGLVGTIAAAAVAVLAM